MLDITHIIPLLTDCKFKERGPQSSITVERQRHYYYYYHHQINN